MAREATATVIRSTKESARFALRDLSSGGARLVGELPLFEGEHIWLRIELQDPIEIAADVVHFDHQRKVAEVAFRGVSADALTKIERAIADMIARVPESSPATVLVVHPVLDVSSALERDLAKIGVAARVSATLADITAQLADHAVHYIGVIVSSTFGESLGASLQQIENHDAQLRRVILHGDQIDKIDHPAMQRVHAVLRTPWRFKGLARALDVPMNSVVTTYDQLVALKLKIGSSDTEE